MNGPGWMRCEGSREPAVFRHNPRRWRFGTEYRYGYCSFCGRRLRVFTDGTIWQHKFIRGDRIAVSPRRWDWLVEDVGYPYPTGVES